MKPLFSKLLLCSIAVWLLFNSQTHAQTIDTTFNSNMNHIFGNLNMANVPFGLLRDYAIEFTNVENFDGTTLLDGNKIGVNPSSAGFAKISLFK